MILVALVIDVLGIVDEASARKNDRARKLVSFLKHCNFALKIFIEIVDCQEVANGKLHELLVALGVL